MALSHLPRPSALACVAAPALCILAARMLIPSLGPAPAQAQPAPAPPQAAKDAPKVRDNPDTPELVQAVRDALAAPMGPCTVTAPAERIATPAAQAPPAKPDTPAFTLTSLSGSGRGNIAMINGRPRRAGDDLGTGWTLTAIDLAGGTATLAGPGGRTVTLALRKDR